MKYVFFDCVVIIEYLVFLCIGMILNYRKAINVFGLDPALDGQYLMNMLGMISSLIYIISNVYFLLNIFSSELSAHQKKILPIDDHIGISIAGLTADARTISRYDSRRIRITMINKRP